MSKYKLVKKETKEKTINFKDDSVKSIMLKRRKEEEIAKKILGNGRCFRTKKTLVPFYHRGV